MSKSFRYDQATSALDVIETGEGWLDADVIIARPGVFPYRTPDGGIRFEAKLPQDILSAETVESATLAPLTDDHPLGADGKPVFVTGENYKAFQEGVIGDPRVEDGMIKARVRIFDPELVQEVKNGLKRQVSIGFMSDTLEEPGEFEGMAYDCRQTEIRINHVAVVDIAREGPDVRILVDSGMDVMAEVANQAVSKADEFLTYRTFDGAKDLRVSKELMNELDTFKKKIKADSAEMDAMKAQIQAVKPVVTDPDGAAKQKELMDRADALSKEHDALLKDHADLKAKYDDLEGSMDDRVDAAAAEKADAVGTARAIDGNAAPEVPQDHAKYDGLSAREIKLQAINKVIPDVLKGKKFDSIPKAELDVYWTAAKATLAARARQQLSSSTPVIDANDIEKKRQDLKNVKNWRKEGK